jgi:hypothetical protein
MKRVILFIGLMVVGLLAEGDIQAQRRNENSRNQDNKMSKRDDGRRDSRFDTSSDKKRMGTLDRYGRRITKANNVVLRSNGYRYSSRHDNRRRYDVVDYDFRNGRRLVAARESAPSARHIWVNGYWEYNRMLRRDVWITGQWAIQRKYHRYQDAHYTSIGGARVWVSGCWLRIS